MQLREVGVAGYRSLHALRFPVGQLTVFVGPNGVGKTTDFGIRWLRPRRRVCHPGAHSRRHSRAQPGNRGRVSRRTSRRSVAGRTAWFGLIFPDYPKRVFEAAELSDGTLHFLGLAGTLLGYRLPTFIALNEPKASLHPDLLEPLARMIIRAAERTQIWVVTHSERLGAAFAAHGNVTPCQVIKRNGEIWIEGLALGGHFRDEEGDD